VNCRAAWTFWMALLWLLCSCGKKAPEQTAPPAFPAPSVKSQGSFEETWWAGRGTLYERFQLRLW